MIETPEMKAKLEAVLEKARRLKPWRQLRESLALELGNLQHNFAHLVLAGKTLAGEKARIQNEIEKLNQDERNVLHELQQFFASLVEDATRSVNAKIAAVMSKRLRLRDLLAEAGTIYGEVEQGQKNWSSKLHGLRKVAAELENETKEPYKQSYQLPEISFPSLPSPNKDQTIRLRTHADNMAEILQGMANQIG
jgi:chromosome segregation ATPase